MCLYHVQGLRPEVSHTEPHQEVYFVFVFVRFLYDFLEHVLNLFGGLTVKITVTYLLAEKMDQNVSS